MKYNYFLVALVAQFFAATVAADTGYKYLGYGRLVTNDLLGDGKDRWRTGSVSAFRMYVQHEVDLKYLKLSEAVELRTHFEVVAPSDLQAEDGGIVRGVVPFLSAYTVRFIMDRCTCPWGRMCILSARTLV